MLFDEILIDFFNNDIGFKRIFCLQFKMFCNDEKWQFFNFNTDSRISLCAKAHYLRYVESKHQGYRKAFSDFWNFVLVRKNNDFAEFKVHLIHRKQVPILHNTELIFCDEGARLVAVTDSTWQNSFLHFCFLSPLHPSYYYSWNKIEHLQLSRNATILYLTL